MDDDKGFSSLQQRRAGVLCRWHVAILVRSVWTCVAVLHSLFHFVLLLLALPFLVILTLGGKWWQFWYLQLQTAVVFPWSVPSFTDEQRSYADILFWYLEVISLIVACIFPFHLMSVLLHATSTGKEMCKSESKPFCHKDSYSKLGGHVYLEFICSILMVLCLNLLSPKRPLE